MNKTDIPVLILSYNRSDTTIQILNKIKKANSKKVYFYSDFPKSEADFESCTQVRNLSEWVASWTELKTFFPAQNLGPRKGVADAIDWFFENEEMGIILEHDCLPSDDFFEFAFQMLQKYSKDPQVMHISGMSPYENKGDGADYSFIRIPLIWGWATWRRAWKLYDPYLTNLEHFISSGLLNEVIVGRRARANWIHYFYAVREGNIQTWDYSWTYSIMSSDGICITPRANMISNIGFSSDALHCNDTKSWLSNMPTYPIEWPLKHPNKISIDFKIEKKLNEDVFRYKTIKYILHLINLNIFAARSVHFRQLVRYIVKTFRI